MKKLYTFENRWHKRYVSLLLMSVFFFCPILVFGRSKDENDTTVMMWSFGIYFASQLFIYLFTDRLETKTEKLPADAKA